MTVAPLCSLCSVMPSSLCFQLLANDASESTLNSATDGIFASATCCKVCICLEEHIEFQGALHGHLTPLLYR